MKPCPRCGDRRMVGDLTPGMGQTGRQSERSRGEQVGPTAISCVVAVRIRGAIPTATWTGYGILRFEGGKGLLSPAGFLLPVEMVKLSTQKVWVTGEPSPM